MSSTRKHPVKTNDTAFRVVEGEAVVISPKEGDVRVLNEVGTLIWELCNGKNTIEDLVEEVMKKFDVAKNIALADVEEFVQELVKEGLLKLLKE